VGLIASAPRFPYASDEQTCISISLVSAAFPMLTAIPEGNAHRSLAIFPALVVAALVPGGMPQVLALSNRSIEPSNHVQRHSGAFGVHLGSHQRRSRFYRARPIGYLGLASLTFVMSVLARNRGIWQYLSLRIPQGDLTSFLAALSAFNLSLYFTPATPMACRARPGQSWPKAWMPRHVHP
jgi:hypothetical protein